jgi:hypothetical protein
MSRVLSHPFVTRRTMLLLVAIAAATLLTLGLLLEPADRAGRDVDAKSSGGAATNVAAPDASGAYPAEPAVMDPAIGTTASPKLDEEGAFKERAAGGVAAPAVAADGVARTADSIAPVGGGGLDAPSLDSKIIRTATLELEVKRGSFEDAWSDAQAIAGSHGGYIVSASRSGAGDSTRLGTITMRVPTAKFDSAVDRIRDIDRTKVEQLDVASQDVTQEYVDTRSRLRHDRAVEGRLLALLAETDGVSEVLAVQSRLDQVQEQIEVEKGRIDYLDKLTSMSTITVSLHGPGSKAEARKDDDSVLGEAWTDARERFAENVASAIVWVGGALPTLLVLAAIGLVGRIAWHRRSTRNGADSGPETLA